MTSINVKPGVFGHGMRSTHNPVFSLFTKLLRDHGIAHRLPTQDEENQVFCMPRELTRSNGLKGKKFAIETHEVLETKHLDIRMEVSEIRFDGNIVFTWCGALVLERPDQGMIDPESAEAQAIIDIWQEV